MYKEIALISPYQNTSVYTANAVLGAAPDWTAILTTLITSLVQQGFSYFQAESKAKAELKQMQLQYAQQQQNQNPGGATGTKDNTMLIVAGIGILALFFAFK